MKEPTIPSRLYEKLDQVTEDMRVNDIEPEIRRQIEYLRKKLQERLEEEPLDPILAKCMHTL